MQNKKINVGDVVVTDSGTVLYTANKLKNEFRKAYPNGSIVVTEPKPSTIDVNDPNMKWTSEARVYADMEQKLLLANAFACKGSDENIDGFTWAQTAAISAAITNAGITHPLLSESERVQIVTEKEKDIEKAAESVKENLAEITDGLIQEETEVSKEKPSEKAPAEVEKPEEKTPETEIPAEEEKSEGKAPVEEPSETKVDDKKPAESKDTSNNLEFNDNGQATLVKDMPEPVEYPEPPVVNKMIDEKAKEGENLLAKAEASDDDAEKLDLYKQAAQIAADCAATFTKPDAIKHRATKGEKALRQKLEEMASGIKGAETFAPKGTSLIYGGTKTNSVADAVDAPETAEDTKPAETEAPAEPAKQPETEAKPEAEAEAKKEPEQPKKPAKESAKALAAKYSKPIPEPDDDSVSDEDKVEAYKTLTIQTSIYANTGISIDSLFDGLANKEGKYKRIVAYYTDAGAPAERKKYGDIIKFLMSVGYKGVTELP